MKSKQRMKLSSRITTMLMSCAVVFALMLVISIGGAGKAYAAAGDVMLDSEGNRAEGNYKGLDWRIVEKADGSGELQLGRAGSESDGNVFESGKTSYIAEGFESGSYNNNAGIIEDKNFQAGDSDYFEAEIAAMVAAMNAYPWNNYPEITSVKIVTDISFIGNCAYMFSGLKNVTDFTDLNKIDTKEVTSARRMFGWIGENPRVTPTKVVEHACSAVEAIDIASWDLSKADDIAYMFQACRAVKSIDISGFKCKPVAYGYMFDNCNALESINFGRGFDTSIGQSLDSMFNQCENLTSLNLSWMNTQNILTFHRMFNECKFLKTITGLGQFRTGNAISFALMFRNCERLPSVASDVANWDVSSASTFRTMFGGCKSMKGDIDLSGWNVTSNVYNTQTMFGNSGFTSIDVSGWDVSGVYKMNGMFNQTLHVDPKNYANSTTNLTTITGLDTWNTSMSDSFEGMFSECRKLQSVKGVESWDTSKATSLRNMFRNCNSLTGDLDLSGWDVSNVDDFYCTFIWCKGLESVNVTGWNTKEVLTIGGMFNGCEELTDIEGIGDWDTSKVTHMGNAFKDCKNLTSTDVLELDMSKVESAYDAFLKTNALLAALDSKRNSETDPQKKADLEIAKNEIAAFSSAVTDPTAVDKVKAAAKAYSKTKIEDAKLAATIAVTEAIEAENVANDSNSTPSKKAAAIKALAVAHKAVGKVEDLANNTDESNDKTKAEELREQLEEGAEARQNDRLTRELEKDVADAKIIDTSTRSAATVRVLEKAIAAAEDVLDVSKNPDAKSADKAKAQQELKAAVDGLKGKSPEEIAYDTADAEAKAAVAEANAAKQAYEEAKAKADEAEKKADEEIAKSPGSDAAVAATEAAKKAAEDAATAAENYATAAQNAKSKTYDANEAGKATNDPVIKKNASSQNHSATLEDNTADTRQTAADKANVEAAVAYAEQLEEAADIARNNGDLAKAAELENKAAEAWGDVAEKADKVGNDEQKANAETKQTQAKDDAKTTADTALTTAIADAKKIDTGNATPESKKALEDAIANAEKVLADPASTPEQKLAAAKAVTDAIKNLKSLDSKVGQEITVSKNVYVITKDPGATWDGEVSLKTAKNAKNVSVPKVVTYEGKNYEVNRVQAGAFRAKKIRKVTLGANIEKLDKNAFKNSKATTIVVKTKALKKASVKGALKGSKVKTVQVKVGSKKVNKKYVKKYKKIFTKKNAGKKVTVK